MLTVFNLLTKRPNRSCNVDVVGGHILDNTSSAECAAEADGHRDGVVTKRTASSRWNGADGGGHTRGNRHRIGFLLRVSAHIKCCRRVRVILAQQKAKISSTPHSTLCWPDHA